MTTPLAPLPPLFDRAPISAGAEAILDARLRCVVEVCVDVPDQRWEPRLLICRDDADAVANAAAEWIATSPGQDVRLAGYTRDTLRRVDDAPAPICHVCDLADVTPSTASGEGS